LLFSARNDYTQLAFYRLAPGFFGGIGEKMPGKMLKEAWKVSESPVTFFFLKKSGRILYKHFGERVL
jgi:hypothetical protein